jgi:hypothetical protein
MSILESKPLDKFKLHSPAADRQSTLCKHVFPYVKLRDPIQQRNREPLRMPPRESPASPTRTEAR